MTIIIHLLDVFCSQDLISDKQGIRVVSDGGVRDLYEKGKFTH